VLRLPLLHLRPDQHQWTLRSKPQRSVPTMEGRRGRSTAEGRVRRAVRRLQKQVPEARPTTGQAAPRALRNWGYPRAGPQARSNLEPPMGLLGLPTTGRQSAARVMRQPAAPSRCRLEPGPTRAPARADSKKVRRERGVRPARDPRPEPQVDSRRALRGQPVQQALRPAVARPKRAPAPEVHPKKERRGPPVQDQATAPLQEELPMTVRARQRAARPARANPTSEPILAEAAAGARPKKAKGMAWAWRPRGRQAIPNLLRSLAEQARVRGFPTSMTAGQAAARPWSARPWQDARASEAPTLRLRLRSG
jgi:hypothetical protein